MENVQLQEWVERISLQSFGRPFRHQARFNSRLRTTGGRYYTRTHDIDISRLQYDTFGTEEVEKIIKHELCHYHLHLAHKGFMHRDPEFKALLVQVGGSRYCRELPGRKPKAEPYRYKLECNNCGMVYMRKRKVDPRRFVCGRCRGKLKLVALPAGNSVHIDTGKRS